MAVSERKQSPNGLRISLIGSLIIGALAFTFVQALYHTYSRNDLSGFTPVCVLLGGASFALGVLLGRRPATFLVALVALLFGYTAALVVWMFTTKPGGPGNLWPIEIVVETVLDVLPALAGALLGYLVALVLKDTNKGRA